MAAADQVGGWAGAVPRLTARRSAATKRGFLAVAIVPMVALSVWLALTSDHLQRPVVSGLYWGYLTAAPMAIGLLWWNRRPASGFGPLLVGFGVLTWIVSWESSDLALAFDLAVLAEAPYFWMTFYLFLAFPSGRLEPPAARWLMGALALGIVVFFVPWALFSPVIAGGGPLTGCAPDCPPNVLQVGTAPEVVLWAGRFETYAALALTLVALAIYARRLRAASRPKRRALIAVAVTSLLFLPAYFVFNLSAWILKLDPGVLDGMAWAIVVTRVLMPLGFLIALVQAELFAARALRDLLGRLATRPTPDTWRRMIASALDDPELRLAYYDPDAGSFRESDGATLVHPAAGSSRTWVPVDRGGLPVAAMVIDDALAEDPELVRAAASATLLAVENGHLEGELRASRARIVEAGIAERRRIERDLHDSAQQRLVALRIRLSLAGELLDRSDERAMLERLGVEVDEAIDELRNVAHGIYPQVLAQGVQAALAAVAARLPMPVTISGGLPRRYAERIETTVYFCCVECLQNAAKHAGQGAVVTIRLGEHDDRVTFAVEDDGIGFDPSAVADGTGLTNLADRVAAVGGTLDIDAGPGRGTRVIGELPASG